MLGLLLAILSCAAPAVSQYGSWVRQADNVCFSATKVLDTELFESQLSGLVGGVRFVYRSGGVACSVSSPLTKFGCYSPSQLMTALFSESKDAVIYPVSVTDGLTTFTYIHENLVDYFMHRKDDGILTLIQPIYSVQRGQMFRVEYTEVLNEGKVSDNRGTTCVSVDFLFLSCDDNWNFPAHNCTDASLVELAQPALVAEVLVQ